jgi:hypothetical protein
LTPVTVVQAPAPEGLDCRLNPVAALCVLSTEGVVQFTVRLLPVPCASVTALTVFGGYGVDGAAAIVAGTDGSPERPCAG